MSTKNVKDAMEKLKISFPNSIEVSLKFIDKFRREEYNNVVEMGWVAYASLCSMDICTQPLQSSLKTTPLGAVRDLINKRSIGYQLRKWGKNRI